jgi:hypothetical protein
MNGSSVDRAGERQTRVDVLRPSPSILQATEAAVDGSIILMPEALYHVDELGPLYRELDGRGHSVQFMLSPKTVPAAHAALGRYVESVVAYDLAVADHAAAIVVLNDWGPTRELLLRANARGVPTFAKVEGVQDFDDVDTGRERHAYRTASTILGQGVNDVAALPDKCVEIVGSTRLERIWTEGPIDLTDRVLVNLNFTFNVLTEHRSEWIASVRDAVRTTGLDAGVSAHPAERSTNVGMRYVDKAFRHEITQSGVLVSRFSTVPFEAMARGVPFVYHNPHGERVPTFKAPDGAFPVTTSAAELSIALVEAIAAKRSDRSDWESFFRAQVDIDPGMSPERRTAEVIEKMVL